VPPLEPPTLDSEELLLAPPSLLEPPLDELPPTLEMPPLLDELLTPPELPPLAEELPPWLLLAPPLPPRLPLELEDDWPADEPPELSEVLEAEHPPRRAQQRIKARLAWFRMGTSETTNVV
jgi:hypothetical protein